MLAEHGIDPIDVAYRLSDTLPFIISKDFNPNGKLEFQTPLLTCSRYLLTNPPRALPPAPVTTSAYPVSFVRSNVQPRVPSATDQMVRQKRNKTPERLFIATC